MLETISRNFKYRLSLSMGLIGAIILLIYYSHTPMMNILFTGFVALVASHGLSEFYHMAEAKKIHPLYWIGVVTGFLFIFAVYDAVSTPKHLTYPFILLFVSLLAAFIYLILNREEDALLRLSLTYFGLIYIALPLSFCLLINYRFEEGQWWLFYILLLTKTSDTGAYFIGKTFGRHLLAPAISPKKTIEGMVGGILAPLAISLIAPAVSSFFNGANPFKMSLYGHLLLAFSISILAQIGDLAESLLKRDAKIKDSNKWPGLGGTMDIIDSLIFTLPFSYWILTQMVDI